ncbi:curlin [Methyloligella solikamskensis]|uniref:Curlin n=1 Tax=Methyloligella solikamskensis TaxID=1177756 RepID=A0ABW3JB13_9HYPH
MTRKTRIKTFKTTMAALVIGACSLGVPATASAGGTISFGITPSGDTARMISTGLQIYSMVEDHKNGSKGRKKNNAHVDQKGKRNAAAIGQSGRRNNGFVVQRGDDHSATLDQRGRNNTLGVFQFGRGATFDGRQNGYGRNAIVFQGGW